MKKLLSLLFCSLFLVSTANAEISLSVSSDSWDLDSISLCETVVSEEAINIVNLSECSVDLGLFISYIDSPWESGLINGYDRFSLCARFDSFASPPGSFNSITDRVKTLPIWATSVFFGPGGYDIPPGGSENLWLQFIFPTATSDSSDKRIVLDLVARGVCGDYVDYPITVNLSFSHSSITEYRPEELALNIFPNPANSSITIEVKKDKGKVASVEIFNTLGEKVLEFEMMKNTISLPIADFPSGIYAVKVRTERASISGNIILLK